MKFADRAISAPEGGIACTPRWIGAVQDAVDPGGGAVLLRGSYHHLVAEDRDGATEKVVGIGIGRLELDPLLNQASTSRAEEWE